MIRRINDDKLERCTVEIFLSKTRVQRITRIEATIRTHKPRDEPIFSFKEVRRTKRYYNRL